MSEEKRTKLGDVFRRQSAEARARIDTDEAKMAAERNADRFRQEEEDRKAWEAANPLTPYENGYDAAGKGLEKEPPDGLSEQDAREWLDGYEAGEEP